MTEINEAKILIIATDGFEQSELKYPMVELERQGATVHLATPDGKEITGWKDKDWAETIKAHLSLSDANADDYDALVIPGGQMNPDILRTKSEAVNLVKAFHESGKTIAAICHGPWMLVEADVLRGRKATSYPSISTDVKNAGAEWVDEAVVVDQAIVTSRNPDDLEAFCAKIVEEVEEGRHNRNAA